jgi:(2Fe-2S) ferredoxin
MYRRHLFFCLNQKIEGRKCCHKAGSEQMHAYAKKRVSDLGLAGPGGVRVNKSGCLGRCSQGPALVIYPEGTWYTYASEADVEEILQQDLLNNQMVTRLLMPEC